MNAIQLSMAYSTAVTKKAMETQETAAQDLIAQMLPQQVSAGQHIIDTYA